jgi:hypothetical protein
LGGDGEERRGGKKTHLNAKYPLDHSTHIYPHRHTEDSYQCFYPQTCLLVVCGGSLGHNNQATKLWVTYTFGQDHMFGHFEYCI